MMNASEGFQLGKGEDSDSNNGVVKSEYSISLSVLISLITFVFIGLSRKKYYIF